MQPVKLVNFLHIKRRFSSERLLQLKMLSMVLLMIKSLHLQETLSTLQYKRKKSNAKRHAWELPSPMIVLRMHKFQMAKLRTQCMRARMSLNLNHWGYESVPRRTSARTRGCQRGTSSESTNFTQRTLERAGTGKRTSRAPRR